MTLRKGTPIRCLLLSITLLAAGCSTTATRDIEAARIKAHTAPLELNGPHGKTRAYIGTDGRLTIGKIPVALDTDQQAATLAYRDAALNVVDLSLDSAARLTRFAIPRVLFGMLIHGADGAGRGIEKDAEKSMHSPAFCVSLETMREKQDAMVAEVAQLRPYAQLTPQDIRDCRSGKPYSHSI